MCTLSFEVSLVALGVLKYKEELKFPGKIKVLKSVRTVQNRDPLCYSVS